MTNKNFAYVFACLLVFQALSTAAVAASVKGSSRGLNLGSSTHGRDIGKEYALPSNKVLVRNPKPASACGCKKSKNTGIHNSFKRTYETIGLCETTVDVVKNTEKEVDYVCTQKLSFKTLKQHNTKYNVLKDTQANQRYVKEFCATIEVLTNVCKTVQTLVPISVSIDVVCTQSACVQSLSCRNAVVKTLHEVQRNLRVIKATKECARRVTDACGKIKAIHRIHQKISQEISRSVTCPKSVPPPPCSCGPTPVKSVPVRSIPVRSLPVSIPDRAPRSAVEKSIARSGPKNH
jgi:hypothetical protein